MGTTGLFRRGHPNHHENYADMGSRRGPVTDASWFSQPAMGATGSCVSQHWWDAGACCRHRGKCWLGDDLWKPHGVCPELRRGAEHLGACASELQGADRAAAPLMASTRDDTNPDYSPDGKTIAFNSHRSAF